jgi:hypothetical protein
MGVIIKVGDGSTSTTLSNVRQYNHTRTQLHRSIKVSTFPEDSNQTTVLLLKDKLFAKANDLCAPKISTPPICVQQKLKVFANRRGSEKDLPGAPQGVRVDIIVPAIKLENNDRMDRRNSLPDYSDCGTLP